MKKRALGRGLEALFDDGNPLEELEKLQTEESKAVKTLRISEIEPNKQQPRRSFEKEALLQLAESIGQHGVLQPILVTPIEKGGYRIVAGERRWRAARMAGLSEVPVVIKSFPEDVAFQLALIENLQREDLNPVEEAEGYYRLCEEYHMTQEQAAKVVGKSRPVVANALRLLRLSDEILALVESGELTAGHARTILSFPEEQQLKIAKYAIEKKLSVRELEELAAKSQKKQQVSAQEKQLRQDSFYDEVQLKLQESFGKKAVLKVSQNQEKGKIELTFQTKEELKELLERLSLSESGESI